MIGARASTVSKKASIFGGNSMNRDNTKLKGINCKKFRHTKVTSLLSTSTIGKLCDASFENMSQ